MNNLSHTSNMNKNIDLINLFQTGKISQAQFLKSIAKLQTPEQAIEKKQHKIAKTKTTKIINTAVKNYSASKKITNDIIAQGNTLIQKLQMGYDIQNMKKLDTHFKKQHSVLQDSDKEIQLMMKNLKEKSKNKNSLVQWQHFNIKIKFQLIEASYDTIQNDVVKFMNDILGRHHNLKIMFQFRVELRNEIKNVQDSFYFVSHLVEFTNTENIEKHCDKIVKECD